MKIISNKYENKTSKELNKTISGVFTQEYSISKPNDINLLIDSAKVYEKERNESTCYRITANLNLIASNILFNISGDTSYETILELMNFNEEDQEFEFTQDEILLGENGWYYFLTGDTLQNCNRVYLEPTQEKFKFLNSSGYKNWDFFLTYPSTKDNTLSIDGVELKDGIRVNSMSLIQLNNRTVLKLFTSIKHGLIKNDKVKIKNLTTLTENTYTVYKIGDEKNDYIENAFIIDVNDAPPDPVAQLISMTKIIDGIESQYYKRNFKKLTNQNDFNLYPNSFSKNTYGDDNFLITFEKDIDVSLLRDYLNRPISEIYLSIVKTPYYISGETYWSSIKSGIKSVFAYSDYDINTLTTHQNIAINANINANDGFLFGDIVEYNPISQTEIILDVAYHRFNTKNRDEAGYEEGYYYKPHYLFQIKQYDSEITESYSEENVPDYAVFLNGKYIWKEQLSNSFLNSADIVFMNGCHYIYKDIIHVLKRQDPCGEFELSDTIVSGDCITFEDIISKKDDEVC